MAKKELTTMERGEAFKKEYEELCKKYNCEVGFTPDWRYSEDGNDWRLVIRPVIVPKN